MLQFIFNFFNKLYLPRFELNTCSCSASYLYHEKQYKSPNRPRYVTYESESNSISNEVGFGVQREYESSSI
jgi:hypothetical protein